jgi:hypothetical protein
MREQKNKKRNLIFLAIFKYLECIPTKKNVEGFEKIQVVLLELYRDVRKMNYPPHSAADRCNFFFS